MITTDMNENQIREIIRDELKDFISNERYTFQKHLQIFDGRNIQTGRGTGTKICTASDQKLGLWGTTPVNQPETVSDASTSTVSGSGADATINSNFGSLQTATNAIIARLKEVGIIK